MKENVRRAKMRLGIIPCRSFTLGLGISATLIHHITFYSNLYVYMYLGEPLHNVQEILSIFILGGAL